MHKCLYNSRSRPELSNVAIRLKMKLNSLMFGVQAKIKAGTGPRKRNSEGCVT